MSQLRVLARERVKARHANAWLSVKEYHRLVDEEERALKVQASRLHRLWIRIVDCWPLGHRWKEAGRSFTSGADAFVDEECTRCGKIRKRP